MTVFKINTYRNNFAAEAKETAYKMLERVCKGFIKRKRSRRRHEQKLKKAREAFTKQRSIS